MKKIFIPLVILTLVLCLYSCGGNNPCETHVDDNSDNVCDACGEAVGNNESDASEVKLVENGKPVFGFVIDSKMPTTVRLEINDIAKSIKKATGIEIKVSMDNDNSEESDYEVLVGNVKSRGEECEYDYHTLGPKGKAIKIVGTKLILAGGSEDMFLEIIEAFAEDILKLDGNELTENNVTATLDDCFDEPQTEYRITSLSVGDVSMRGHRIIIDMNNPAAVESANLIQTNLYSFSGYWLPIVDEKAATSRENAIVIKILEKDGVSEGYKLYVSDSSIIFEIMYDNKLAEKVAEFLAPIKLKSGDVKLTSSLNKTENIRVITYQGYFKNKGQTIDNTGMSDVSPQIKEVHAYANKYGHDVKAEKGKYLIGPANGSEPIVIMTNTDFTGAEFIVDDRNIEANTPAADSSIIIIGRSYNISYVGDTHESVKKINNAIKEAGEISFPELTNFFGLTFSGTTMIRVRNTEHKNYIRYGGNANDGAEQTENIIVDKDGNIIDNSGFLLDYTKVTDLAFYKVEEDSPITITGGTFITRANKAVPSYSTGFSRNISIQRSNVTVKNLTHKITDEGDVGTCYTGFLGVSSAYNVLFEDCTVQAHRMYYDETVQPDGTIKYGTTMGTYDLGCGNSINVYYKNCVQSNYYDKNGNASKVWYDEKWNTGISNNKEKNDIATVWGIMGSNYSKNITYDNCTLNRIDAHAGAFNITVKNNSRTVDIALTGGGKALVEDTIIDNYYFVYLREDYGATWKGTVEIKNCQLIPKERDNSSFVYVYKAQWYCHDFGYPCYLPETIIDNVSVEGFDKIYFLDDLVSNLKVDVTPDDDSNEKIPLISVTDTEAVATEITIGDYTFENINPYILPKEIIIKNCSKYITFVGAYDAELNKIIEPLFKRED